MWSGADRSTPSSHVPRQWSASSSTPYQLTGIPSELPTRVPPSTGNPGGRCFVIGVVIFLLFQYGAYISTVLKTELFPHPTTWGVAYALLFHFFFVLLVASFIQTSSTDPGCVPANWGFYLGDGSKRRRYCKVCNVWKPDRTHHCSACGRCVLNMDHHCPWVNNCVGFNNRKFFLQLLVYSIICLGCVAVHASVYIIDRGPTLLPSIYSVSLAQYIMDAVSFGAAVLVLLFTISLIIPLIPFTRFHFSLVARNSTTIENMAGDANCSRGKYDLGVMRNFQQVLGPHQWLWWFPGHCPYGPVGDGVRWTQNYMRVVGSDDG